MQRSLRLCRVALRYAPARQLHSFTPRYCAAALPHLANFAAIRESRLPPRVFAREYRTTVAVREESKKPSTEEKKKTKIEVWRTKIKEVITHYWHGSRLFVLNIRTAYGLTRRLLNGGELTRREKNLLRVTVGDLFKLVPMAIIVLVPLAV
jgi:hypothetical protein